MTHALLDCTQPDAIFVFGPRIAAGAAGALRERGLCVPEDVALVCVDDFGMGSELDPFMTIVRQPEGEDGAPGCQVVDRAHPGTLRGRAAEIILPAQVVVRRSCGAKLMSPVADREDGNASAPAAADHTWEDD